MSLQDEDVELNDMFRHKAMESAKTVMHVVLTHTRIDLAKHHYDTALAITDVFAGEYLTLTSFLYVFLTTTSPTEESDDDLLDVSNPEEAAMPKVEEKKLEAGLDSRNTRTTQFALVMFITHGVWTFRESPPASEASSSFASLRAHEIEFNNMRVISVTQNVANPVPIRYLP